MTQRYKWFYKLTAGLITQRRCGALRVSSAAINCPPYSLVEDGEVRCCYRGWAEVGWGAGLICQKRDDVGIINIAITVEWTLKYWLQIHSASPPNQEFLHQTLLQPILQMHPSYARARTRPRLILSIFCYFLTGFATESASHLYSSIEAIQIICSQWVLNGQLKMWKEKVRV